MTIPDVDVEGHRRNSGSNPVVDHPMVVKRRSSTSSLFRNASTTKLEKTQQHHDKEMDETMHVTSLTHSKQGRVEKKDFSKVV